MQQNESSPTKLSGQPDGVGDPERAALVAIRQVEPEVGAVTEQLDDVADALAAHDDHHLADAHPGERRDRVVDHRPVVDRQQVLVGDDGEWEEPRRGPTGEDDALHRAKRSRGGPYGLGVGVAAGGLGVGVKHGCSPTGSVSTPLQSTGCCSIGGRPPS